MQDPLYSASDWLVFSYEKSHHGYVVLVQPWNKQQSSIDCLVNEPRDNWAAPEVMEQWPEGGMFTRKLQPTVSIHQTNEANQSEEE